jgi:hypothetical protein
MKTAWVAMFMSAAIHLGMFRIVVSRNGDPIGKVANGGKQQCSEAVIQSLLLGEST